VEGVALTRKVAFVANKTNFFIQSRSSADAIRVFANTLVMPDVNPGDIVRVTGVIGEFNGLRQIGDPDLLVEVIGSNGQVTASRVSRSRARWRSSRTRRTSSSSRGARRMRSACSRIRS